MTWLQALGCGVFAGLLAVGCGDTSQEFGPPPAGGGGTAGTAASGGSAGAAGAGAPMPPAPASDFEWLNPKPHGNIFRAVAATSDANVWVGGRGAVLAWNGQKWTTYNPGQPDELYHALWVKGSSDVWVGGTRLEFPIGASAPTESTVLYHFDGMGFTAQVGLEKRTIRALTGTPTEGYLVLDGGEIRRFDGKSFVSDKPASGAELWAVWPVGPSEVWAVGSAGTLLHRTDEGWAQVKSTAFSDKAHFIGVWGASPSDVWAIYEENPLNGQDQYDFPDLVGNVGFVHYDGSAWTEFATAPANCSKVVSGLAPWSDNSLYAIHYSNVRGEVKSRRGPLIHGRSSSDITASLGNGYCTWHYDGSAWSVLPLEYKYSFYGNSKVAPFLAFPLGGLPTVWATATQTLLAGAGGQLLALDSSIGFPVPTDEPPSGGVTSPATAEVFAGDRGTLNTVALHEKEAYSSQHARAVAWTASGWTPLVGPPGSLDPASLGVVVSVSAEPGGQVWAVGGPAPGWSKWFAARWDGSAWSQVSVQPPADSTTVYDGFPELWQAPGGGDIWLYGENGKRLRRNSGQGFELMEFPDYLSFIHDIDGTANDDVWVAGWNPVLPGPGKHVVYHFDGSGFQEAYVFPQTRILTSAWIAATGQDQAILFATERIGNWPGTRTNASLRFDGSSWQPFEAPVDIGQVWVRSANDIYALSLAGKTYAGSGAEGDRRLYHYDGQGWRVAFAADSIRRIAGSEHSLWLVGEYGSTVRAKLPAPVR